MATNVIPFPCGCMTGEARRLALITYRGTFPGRFPGQSAEDAKAYDRKISGTLRRSMERAGIDEDTIDRELIAFTHIVMEEFRRLCRDEFCKGRGGHVMPQDGGDAA